MSVLVCLMYSIAFGTSYWVQLSWCDTFFVIRQGLLDRHAAVMWWHQSKLEGDERRWTANIYLLSTSLLCSQPGRYRSRNVRVILYVSVLDAGYAASAIAVFSYWLHTLESWSLLYLLVEMKAESRTADPADGVHFILLDIQRISIRTSYQLTWNSVIFVKENE